MIYIVPDTNQVYVTYGKSKELYDVYCVNSVINKLEQLCEKNCCVDDVKILVSEITIRELAQQKYESYEKDCEELYSIAKRMGVDSLPVIKDKRDFVNDEIERAYKYFEKVGIGIVPLCSSVFFSEIITNAVNKEPPFEGKNKKSDKGFKDTLFFYSIVEYAFGNTGEYFILSEDNIFNETINAKILRNKFLEHSGCRLNIIKNIEDLKSRVIIHKSSKPLESVSYMFAEKRENLKIGPYGKRVDFYQKKPIFEGDEPIVHVLNRRIDSIYDSDRDYWDTDNACYYDDDPEIIYESSLSASIMNNSSSLLSIILYDHKYVGGIHGSTMVSTYTFDITNGCQISLSQILHYSNEDLCKMINMCVNKDISSSEPDKYFDEAVNIMDSNNIEYYVRNNEIHIIFNEYELGPFASGIIDLVLCRIEDDWRN